MAAWLDEHLPGNARMLVSPQCVRSRPRRRSRAKHDLCEEVSTGAHPADMLKAAGWPRAPAPW